MKTVNQNIKPITTEINQNGNLQIGGCDLVSLAKKYGTPLYVIDEKTLRTACKEYKQAFSNYQNTQLMYASKALCTIATSTIIAQEGFGFDVVSAGEIYTVSKSNVDMEKVLFNGNNKSYDELCMAIDYKIGRISVDNFSELEMLKSINKPVNVLLRITPGIECHTHDYIKTGMTDSKFGFDMSQIDDAIKFIQNCENINLKGFHAHIGSQIFETTVYGDEIDILVKLIYEINKKYNIDLDEINIGGGLGVKYVESDCPPSVFEIADIITTNLNKSIEKYNLKPLKLIVEPGRSIISTSGVTLYTIGSSKQVPNGKKYVAIDGGMSDNMRHAMYQAEYYAQIANKKDTSSLQNVTIAGRFCESGDILIRNIKLKNPEKDDILCVFCTGAYNYSMASNYNRVQKSAMVLVNNFQSDMIVMRESLDDLISHDCILKGGSYE